jgi:hypothetical protein
LNHENEIKEIISLSHINGGPYWSREDGDIHAPHGFSTIDVLNTLGEIGVKASVSEVVINAINLIFTYYDEKGCFRYAPKSSKLPCITARILTALGRLGYTGDERIETCYRHLLETQHTDGGWRCPTVRMGKSPETDSSNPGTTLYVLDAFRFRDNAASENTRLEKGVVFLLDHWETRKPLGPCQFGIGSRFLTIEYPFLRYNLFYYVYVLSQYNIAKKDKRYREALLYLQNKAIDQKILPESPHTSWRRFSFARKNEYSEIATNRFLEITGE